MAHYRMTDKSPSAIITVDGNEKKIYEGNQVFLKNGDNFEIRFFNPLNEKIGVEILFNGQKKNDGLLVLRPGEDIILDRFLGENKKMKFDTYTIDGDNSAAVEATKLNGLIEFKFYKEKSFNYTIYNDTNFILSGASIGIYNSTSSAGLPHFGCTSTSNNFSEYVCESNTSYDYTQEKSLKRGIKKETELETGRIEKGSESEQELKTVDDVFDTTSFHAITYQMKPNSTKLKTVSEVRNYCTHCGYRLRKKSWSFCPKCGGKI